MQELLTSKAAELAPYFKPAFLQRDHTVFQFEFDAEPAFYLTVSSQDFKFEAGRAPEPTLTLSIDNHETCWQLLSGQLDGMQAFMAGRYRADGHIVLSQLLLYLFKSNDPTVPSEVQA